MNKKTPLYDSHVALGAQVVEFGGWDMPVQYSNVIEEHTITRTKAGLFDICHMGEFFVNGKDAARFLQKIITNNIENLESGKCFYTCMCNEKGGVIDDLFVYKFSNEKFMLVVNAGTVEKDFSHLKKNSEGFDVELDNETDSIGKIDLQGPNSEAILKNVLDFDILGIKRFNFVEDKFNGNRIIVSRTGYTGEDGFELYIDSKNVVKLWEKILDAGKELGIKPIGLGARDTLRLESCYSLYGHEITEDITPIEAGLGFVVKLDKGNFIGRDVLKRQKEEGTERKLVAIDMIDRGIPRAGYKLLKEGKETGFITSGTFSPSLRKPIALGFVSNAHSEPGTELEVDIRGKTYKSKVVKKPFYEFHGKK